MKSDLTNAHIYLFTEIHGDVRSAVREKNLTGPFGHALFVKLGYV
jgi:hypothetical protein